MVSNLQKKIVIFIASLVMLIELLDGTALNTCIPQMAKDFGLRSIDLSLPVTVYLFALSSCIPLSAFFVEKFGIKKVLVMAMFVFMLGSIGCSYSLSLGQLTLFRLIQGIGGSFMLPVGRLAISSIFGRDLVKAMTIVTSISLTGPLMGPVLGGYLTTNFGWQWIFLINIPFSALAIILIVKYFPQSSTSIKSKFDFIGFLILLTGFGLFIFGSELYTGPYPLMQKLIFSFIGIGILCLYVPYARKLSTPLMDLKIFQNLTFKYITYGNFLIRFAMSAYTFVLPILLFQKYKYSSFDLGLLMLPIILGGWLVKPFIPKLFNSIDKKIILLTNSLLLAFTQFNLIFYSFTFNYIYFILYGLILGSFNSIQFSLLNSSMFFSLQTKDKAHGNAIYLSLTQLGSCLGIAFVAISHEIFTKFSLCDLNIYQLIIVLIVLITTTSVVFFGRLSSDLSEAFFDAKQV